MRIAYDHELSTEMSPKYYVYDEGGIVIYKGDYVQCLVIVGAFNLHPEYTLEDVRSKTNGFI